MVITKCWKGPKSCKSFSGESPRGLKCTNLTRSSHSSQERKTRIKRIPITWIGVCQMRHKEAGLGGAHMHVTFWGVSGSVGIFMSIFRVCISFMIPESVAWLGVNYSLIHAQLEHQTSHGVSWAGNDFLGIVGIHPYGDCHHYKANIDLRCSPVSPVLGLI